MTEQNHKYNFSIKREKRKLACFSEREKNQPKVNGKEFDGMHGLNTYDYGARQYNPITTRWDRVDPLCEKYYNVTPYHYCHSNPMNRIDPDGKDDYYTRGGVYLGTNQAETDFIYITDAGQYRKLDNYRYAINLSSRVALNDTE